MPEKRVAGTHTYIISGTNGAIEQRGTLTVKGDRISESIEEILLFGCPAPSQTFADDLRRIAGACPWKEGSVLETGDIHDEYAPP